MSFRLPIRLVSVGDVPFSHIIDKNDKHICTVKGSQADRKVIGESFVERVNKPLLVYESPADHCSIPTTTVFPSPGGEGFVGKTELAPITAAVYEGQTEIVVTFDDEPDIVWKWKNLDESIPWDFRIVEVVALMDLVCIRADQVWQRKGSDEDKTVWLTKALQGLGFVLTC